MRKTLAFLIIIIIALASLAIAQENKTIEMNEKLEFLIGKWKTVSKTPAGGEFPGDLTYEWVMGKNWIRITFVGQHPRMPFWEAHGFMNYDEKAGKYVSYVVFNEKNPEPEYGYWVDENTFRMGTEKKGIDYLKLEGGGVLQKNFHLDEKGNRIDILITTYEKVK